MTDQDHDRRGYFVLRRKYSELYKRSNYLMRNATMVQNRITEYDIRSANTSILRWSKRLKESTLQSIESLPGKDRKVIIGKMIKNDKSLQKVISNGITRAKRELFEANGIQDEDVLSIKNDAVFIIGRKLRTTTFGPVEFRPKHVYSLYLNIERVEFYYDKQNDTISVKGVRDEVVEDTDHQKGMIRFFATVMRHLTLDRRDALRKYLIEFSNAYKEKALPVEYYKEFNSENIYRSYMEMCDYTFNLEQASEDEKDMITGVYNYLKFILPLIQVYI